MEKTFFKAFSFMNRWILKIGALIVMSDLVCRLEYLRINGVPVSVNNFAGWAIEQFLTEFWSLLLYVGGAVYVMFGLAAVFIAAQRRFGFIESQSGENAETTTEPGP